MDRSDHRTHNTFQSTPPRRGRLRYHLVAGLTERVSIHAPAQGATERRAWRGQAHVVSIHAPAQGAT